MLTQKEFEKLKIQLASKKASGMTQTAPEQGSISRAFQGGISQVKEGYEQSRSATNPLQLLEGGVKSAAGVVGAAFSPLAPVVEPTIGKGVNYVADKISDNSTVQEFAGSKAGEITSRVVEDVANINTVVGAVAGGMQSLKAGSSVASGAKNATGKVTETIKATTSNAPEKIMQRVARIPKAKQAKFEQMAGESVGKYLTKRGIYGNVDDITTKLYERFSKSKNVADKSLETLQGTFEPAPVKTMLGELLARESRISTPGASSPILGKVQQLAGKTGREGWNMSEINWIKRQFERNNTVDYLRQNLPESVAKAKNLDSAVRKWQLNQAKTLGLKNLDKINKETQLAKQLMDDLGKEYSGGAGNNAMTLTDWVMLSGGDPTAIGGFLVKKTFSTKSVQSALAKALNRNKPVMGDVKADLGLSQVKQLPAPKAGTARAQNNVSIKLRGASSMEKGVPKNSSKPR